MDIVVGTAGHIDHGKTALIKALTGTDADRLPEEKQRGITIDLGFAELVLDGLRIGFVDVPGHERFVKNMLAGASGIDAVLLVIAADEGVMPQTREHFDICRLLDIKTGIIVLTKKDLADDEMLDLVRLEAAELVAGSFLETAPVSAVSSKTGEGISELNTFLTELSGMPTRQSNLVARLPIDRSFVVKGFGTVVTGTLVSGEIRDGDEMELLPVGRNVRVRGLQTHGHTAVAVHAGQRTAVNLAGIDHQETSRGMVLCEKGSILPTQMLDAQIEVLNSAARSLRSRQRVRVHIGTAEVFARVLVLNESGEIEPGANGFVQFRLESPIAAIIGERFVVRRYSPQTTIAGGQILRALTQKWRRKDVVKAAEFSHRLLKAIDNRNEFLTLIVAASGEMGAALDDIRSENGWNKDTLLNVVSECAGVGKIIRAGGRLISPESFAQLSEKALSAVVEFHKREPLSPGISREVLREKVFRFLPAEIFASVIAELEKTGKLVAEKDILRSPDNRQELSESEIIVRDRLVSIYENAGLEPPKLEKTLAEAARNGSCSFAEARKIFQLLLNSNEIVKITEEFYFHSSAINELKNRMTQFAATVSDRLIDVANFKEIAGVSRKYAIPLLEYFDREKVTVRSGDKRLIL